MEYWDLYDKDKNKLNKTVKRGEKLNDDEYHIVINAWIINENNEFLITQRSANKKHPLMWECTGGSILKGETPLEGAIREVKEEVGLKVVKENSKYIGSKLRYYKNYPDILEVFIFKSNALINEIEIQEEEVNDVMWASVEKIKELLANNKFEGNAFLNEALEYNYNDIGK